MNPHLLNNKEANNNVVNIMTGGLSGSGNKLNSFAFENPKNLTGHEVIFFLSSLKYFRVKSRILVKTLGLNGKWWLPA